ncbi:MAG TPA: 16S rRNA (cytosine(1402)-N(4))-methyltransferase RsmH [Dehalococcoidia bacterium]|nr:16S rRNA (cytosine(1402)-N(4))-methyltransferase RsmH [Dehalococcoidia bacterium]
MITMTSIPVHKPVLLLESIVGLNVQQDGKYVDCTLGLGGHSLSILQAGKGSVALLGIDADLEAMQVARKRLSAYADSVIYINDNFVRLAQICRENDFLPADGILFDLGVSSLQLDSVERGFSFRSDAMLDMRFGTGQILTARDIINVLPEDKLVKLLWDYGEERKSRLIARAIVASRPVNSTMQLSGIIEKAVGGRSGKIHPATRTFQAIRIAVNEELVNLEGALQGALDCLQRGGRLVIISYHSLEDRIVKQFMRRESTDCICPPHLPVCRCGHRALLRLIHRGVITPTQEEIGDNPRSRSAKLRIAERL